MSAPPAKTTTRLVLASRPGPAAHRTSLGRQIVGGRAARWGWGDVMAFHVLLFGFGVRLWSLPALAVLGVLARRDPVATGRVAGARATS